MMGHTACDVALTSEVEPFRPGRWAASAGPHRTSCPCATALGGSADGSRIELRPTWDGMGGRVTTAYSSDRMRAHILVRHREAPLDV